jgi:hypothetical protein
MRGGLFLTVGIPSGVSVVGKTNVAISLRRGAAEWNVAGARDRAARLRVGRRPGARPSIGTTTAMSASSAIQLSVTSSRRLPLRSFVEARRARLRGRGGLGVSFGIDGPSRCLIRCEHILALYKHRRDLSARIG